MRCLAAQFSPQPGDRPSSSQPAPSCSYLHALPTRRLCREAQSADVPATPHLQRCAFAATSRALSWRRLSVICLVAMPEARTIALYRAKLSSAVLTPGERRTVLRAGGGGTEVDSRLSAIMVQYLSHQHRTACMAAVTPVSTLPPLSLVHPNVLPQVYSCAQECRGQFKLQYSLLWQPLWVTWLPLRKHAQPSIFFSNKNDFPSTTELDTPDPTRRRSSWMHLAMWPPASSAGRRMCTAAMLADGRTDDSFSLDSGNKIHHRAPCEPFCGASCGDLQPLVDLRYIGSCIRSV